MKETGLLFQTDMVKATLLITGRQRNSDLTSPNYGTPSMPREGIGRAIPGCG